MRRTGIGFLVLSLSVSLWAPVPAAEVEFHPELSLEGEHTDNVTAEPDNLAEGDLIARIRVVLPVVRKWNTGEMAFRYAPSYDRYRDTGYLDNDSHDLSLALENQAGRKAMFNLSAGFNRSVQQGGAESLVSGDLILTEPVDRERMNLALSYNRQISRRWRWTGTLDAADYSYQALDSGEPAGEPSIEDRSEWGGALEFSHSLSRQAHVGLMMRHRVHDLDRTGSEDVEQLALVWSRNLGDPGDEVRVVVGASDRSGEFLAPGQVQARPFDDTDFFTEFSLTKTHRRSTWVVSASRAPSSGGVSAGTTTDTVAGLTCHFVPGPYWSSSFSGRYASQDPLDEDLDTMDSRALAADIEWRPGRKIGYRLGLDYRNQTGPAGLGDISETRGWFGLVWYPRGPQETAGGGR